MSWTTVLLVALCACAVTGQWVQSIDGINIDVLLESAPGAANPTPNIQAANPEPFRPLSMRTIYRPERNYADADAAQATAANGWTTAPAEDDAFYHSLIVDGVQLSERVGGEYTVRAWLQPYQVTGCSNAPPAATCYANPANTDPLTGNTGTNWNCELDRIDSLSSTNRVAFALPVRRFAIHAHHGSWLCIRSRRPNQVTDSTSTAAAQVIMTNLLYQVVPRCDSDATGLVSATENALNPANAWPLPHNCTTLSEIGNDLTIANQVTMIARMHEKTGSNVDVDYLARRRMTKCCGYRQALKDAAGNDLHRKWGVCINPDISSCCDSISDARVGNGSNTNVGGIGKPYNKFREKCCFGGDRDFLATLASTAREGGEPVIISNLDDFCPCKQSRVRDFCGSVQQCCTFTKYTELIPTSEEQRIGKCYDPREQGCCATGDLFNPGAQQCCTVTGVQTLDVACPCSGNSECHTNQTCCKQQWPAPMEGEWCNSYSNYPSGTGPFASQRCLGQCIDTRYQICCNGVACVDEYERCCNSTCCNRFTSTCKMGRRAFNNYDSQDFRIPFETCTALEALTPLRAVIAYVLPIALLVATFLGLAFSMFFAKRMNSLNPLSAYEKALLALSMLIVAFSFPLYFSPLYKYGVVFAWTAFFTIVAALAGLKRLVAVAVFLQLLAIIYLVDPFSSNELLTMAYHRQDRDDYGGTSQGLFVALKYLWEDGPEMNQMMGFRCTRFYDGFFRRDPRAEDQMRWDNPEKYTFGFCAREWIFVLLLLQGVNMILLVLLFFTTIVTHVKNVLVRKVIEQNPLHY